MSLLQPLREFIKERLNAAAEEICRHFEETIGHYEAELDRQRRLLDICGNKAQIRLHDITLPKPFQSGDGDAGEQQRNPDTRREEPEAPRVKEEQHEFYICQSEERLDLRLETRALIVTAGREGSEGGGVDPDGQQLPGLSFIVAAARDQEENQPEESTSTEVTCQEDDVNSYCYEITEDDLRDDDEDDEEGNDWKYTWEDKLSHDMDSSNESGNVHEGKPELRKQQKRQRGKKPFNCPFCGKEFSFRSHLKNHLKIHTGEKPFSCVFCGKRFSRKFDLKTHMRIHTGEKPFSCPECGDCFNQRASLNSHMRTHTEHKPFSCLQCGKRFSRQFHLRPHMKTHASTDNAAPGVDGNLSV